MMKIRIKIQKSKLIILGIVSLLLLILSSYLIYEKWSLDSGNYLLDRYDEVSESCDREYRFGNVKFNCTALLRRYEVKEDGTECFILSLISKKNTLQDITICEAEGFVEWDKTTMITEKVVPIHMATEYHRPPFSPYELKNITYTLMNDDDISNLQDNLINSGETSGDLRIQEEEELISKGYYLSNNLEISEGKEFEKIVFYTGDIKEINIKGEHVEIQANLGIGGQEYTVELLSKAFLYKGSEIVNSSNVKNFNIMGPHQILFLYLDSSTNMTKEDVLSYCSNEENAQASYPLCSSIESLNLNDFKIDNIDEYISNLVSSSKEHNLIFEKLIFSKLISK